MKNSTNSRGHGGVERLFRPFRRADKRGPLSNSEKGLRTHIAVYQLPPYHERESREEVGALQAMEKVSLLTVHHKNGPIFERTDAPLKLLELIGLRVPCFTRSLGFESSAATASMSACGVGICAK